METIGKFEFNRKDLIGHGAFAVVFKGRHKQKRDFEVAVKCINKKNLAKSQSLLGKEIKILKELKHENIVGLLDYQETGGCVYLVMEYCNGGDLAEYLHSKGTLSEDTIRVFLQQIAQAMKVLQSKGILHRDLKPQNILLCHPEGRRSSLNNICIKIADFGFARHLQTNTMAATLCGSPMYMAPEVITSQTYDAKADLWSIGTIVFQCLTGKAPFQASTPQELRLFYESNRKPLPSIPRETSSHLRHLLLGLLQRNHKDRMDFNVFFHHPFLESSASIKKSSPVPMLSYRSSGSASSSSSPSMSHMASPQHSDGEMQRLHQPPSQERPPGCPLKETASEDSGNASSDTEDYVMVPTEFPSEFTCEMGDGSPVEGSLTTQYSGTSLMAEKIVGTAGRTSPSSPCLRCPSNLVSKPAEFSNYSQSVPVPVPTQIRNYQRMAQNQQPAGLTGSTRATLYHAGRRGGCSPGTRAPGQGSPLSSHRLAGGGARPLQFSPAVGMNPESSEQMTPVGTGIAGSPGTQQGSCYRHPIQRRNLNSTPPEAQSPMALPWLPSRRQTVPDLQTLTPGLQTILARTKDKQALPWVPSRSQTVPDLQTLSPGLQTILIRKKYPFKRSLSTGRLADMLLKAACGAQLMTGGSDERLCSEKAMDTTAPPGGCDRVPASPAAVAFTFGSPSREISPPNVTACRRFSVGSPSYTSSDWPPSSHLLQRGAHREADREVMDATPACSLVFHPPELPEDTLMEQAHTDALGDLRFTLAFVLCVMEMASSKDPGLEASDTLDVSFLERSLVADRISLLSREWSYAEQLVLYMKAEEFLSAALHAAKEDIKQGRLIPSATVKQVVRRLNELYKICVTSCRSLNGRLCSFLLDKQRLMDCFNGIAAEKIIYNNTVQMVQSAALDEMFHCGQASIQRYHKALLLMEGLSRIMTEQEDIDTIDKCKECIERRLSALQTSQFP